MELTVLTTLSPAARMSGSGLMQLAYEERFEPDSGVRLICDGRSLLLHQLSIGNYLTVRQKAAFSRALLNYLESVAGRPVTRRVNPKPLSQLDFPVLRTPTFFRFLTPESASFVRRGSFRFGTTSFYRSIEDAGRADSMEGYAAVFVEGKHKSFNACGTAGFNCVMLCGVATPPRDRRNLRDMRDKFGRELIEITNIEAFLSLMSERLGSCAHYIRDVRYLDGKYMSSTSEEFDEALTVLGRGVLDVHKLNVHYWHNLYENLFWPSAFSKPIRFSHERERRLLFEFQSDVSSEFIDVNAPKALEFIRFLPNA